MSCVNDAVVIIDVQTGEVAAGGPESVLVSNGIGSCVAVVLADRRLPLAGIAHIMLPGRAPDTRTTGRTRYAEDGIESLVGLMADKGAATGALNACIAGGGNVLLRPDDVICALNVDSVRTALEARNIHLAASSVGGVLRRRVRVAVKNGTVLCGVGDSPEIVLYDFMKGVCP